MRKAKEGSAPDEKKRKQGRPKNAHESVKVFHYVPAPIEIEFRREAAASRLRLIEAAKEKGLI